MGIKTKQILAVIVGVIPFYTINIYSNLSGDIDYVPNVTLIKHPIFAALVLLIILSLNRFLLRNNLKVFNQQKSTLLYDIAIAFLFLITYYFLLSVGQISYTRWLNENIDRTEVLELARIIFSSWTYTFLLFGPFVVLTQGVWVISSAFALNNLWDLSENKTWQWLVIIFLATVVALVNFHNGIQGVIFWFTVNLTANVFYYKFRRIIPLLIAFYIFQWFDFIGLWFYLSGH